MIQLPDRVRARLKADLVIWLTTVRADGLPQPSIVWFWWDGSDFLIFSRPGKPKLRNIAARPRVALNFNSNQTGGAVATFSGEAVLRPELGKPATHPDYVEKYRGRIEGGLGMTVEEFSDSYSVALTVRPERYRGW